MEQEDIAGLSFEDALKELEKIVGQLERGDVPLEDSLRLYARGDQLRAHCEARLRDAQSRIEQITMTGPGAGSGGTPATAPFDGG